MTMDTYGNTFTVWREAAGSIWDDYVNHLFVKKLQDGTLPKVNFIRYLIQDYIFLIHFSRAWALAVTKAETLTEMRLCAATVNALVNEEINLHIKICAEEGISEEELSNALEETPNLAYTRYVLEAGLSGDFLDLMAALAPCVFGYGEIGARLYNSDHDSMYADWINTYGCEDYQKVCSSVGSLIDQAVELRLGVRAQEVPRWSRLEEHFNMATRLEVGFWQMGLDL
ncbi:MAG: thiaminase II [Rhodospirillaceae bacterium]|nr:thiaminase II [Rhodospirillaceae bacterium]|tara:strand:+ start:1382 stop:2062 length:681 start_codon:yes stop_codon:yes gene_type:complete